MKITINKKEMISLKISYETWKERVETNTNNEYELINVYMKQNTICKVK